MAILKDKSKKKKGENIIGKIIYGFLLFMPLIAVGVACLYAIFNKNAYQSYSEGQITNVVKVDDVNELIEGNTYQINYVENNTIGYVGDLRYTTISFNPTDYGFADHNYNTIRIYANGYITLRELANGQTIYTEDKPNLWGNSIKELSITLSSGTQSYTGNGKANIIFYVRETQKLDNMFYYQLQKLEESDLFNWTKNTGAYTVMHNVTSGIGITNTYTPMLMTYWLLISVIYFIFDIALILVWAVHDKIHELKDAI